MLWSSSGRPENRASPSDGLRPGRSSAHQLQVLAFRAPDGLYLALPYLGPLFHLGLAGRRPPRAAEAPNRRRARATRDAARSIELP